ncbi:MAG: NADP-dependent isocitrate dehydrogenase [Myxococcota bacterium]
MIETRTPPTIIYTHTDEAPALATYSLLPIWEAFAHPAGIRLEKRDISLAGRILAAFSDRLPADQRRSDELAYLGALTKRPEAIIIKLPNISASIPQLKAAILELQRKGFELPDFPDDPRTEEQRYTLAVYERVKGSAVNPVLRQGNSDRRAPHAVKEHARKHPHSMGDWSPDSRTHVATMSGGDFRSNEVSMTMDRACKVRIEHVDPAGTVTVLKDGLQIQDGEIIDATFMSRRALLDFLATEFEAARQSETLLSLHLKGTMMKVSDPIMFGHAVRVYFKDLFEKYEATFEQLGVCVNNGFHDLLDRLHHLSEEKRKEIEDDIQATLRRGPSLAMVDSDRGITNLHAPNDVIVDASMPAMIRSSGRMYNADGQLEDTKAVIPDSTYASVYEEVIRSCKEHGAFDPRTMGSVSNIGLMAQQAEEYGSHDKTFELADDGTVRVVDDTGQLLIEHQVEAGDIWRMCQVKDAAIKNWVKLAVTRAQATLIPTVFWLDEDRPHDRELIRKVAAYLEHYDIFDLDISIRSQREATVYSLERARAGKDTISVTGNVLRDYLTDLFPILEIGTSAKMLSIVPLIEGGGLFETGAGGSAPKHVQQFMREGHLRWDSIGEFLAFTAALEHLADRFDVPTARVMGRCLDTATEQYLGRNKSPSRRVNELDNRGSHYFLALFWAQALSAQSDHAQVAAHFEPVAQALEAEQARILEELNAAQGGSVDLGGYFAPDAEKADRAMRPSPTLNRIIASI